MADEVQKIVGDIRFIAGTQAAYDALESRSSKTLYWCEDTGILYKGDINFTKGVILVDDVLALPKGGNGLVYMNKGNHAGYMWEDGKWVLIIKPVSTVIDANSTNDEIPTAKAVYEAIVAAQMADKEVDLSGYMQTVDADAKYVAKEDMPTTLADYTTKAEAYDVFEHVKYEITNKPNNVQVNYRDKEIRIMCPADTQYTLQNVGATGNANNYYIAMRVYAPSDDVVSFKEDMAYPIADETMYYFEGNDFAGVDKYGRKYSICWLAVANYDESTNTWTYYGKNSTTEKYIGWTYSVEWYNADGVVVDSDCMRINLANEDCYADMIPSYVTSAIADVMEEGEYVTADELAALAESFTWAEM